MYVLVMFSRTSRPGYQRNKIVKPSVYMTSVIILEASVLSSTALHPVEFARCIDIVLFISNLLMLP